MTGKQVILAIKLALDKYSASTSAVIGPAFLDEELCAFANQAMVEVICTKFTGHNQLQLGFELSVKRVADLERLIVVSEHELVRHNANVYTTNPDAFDDQINRLFLVSATVSMNDEQGQPKLFPAELIDRNVASNFLDTPFNKPWIPSPKLITFQTTDSSNRALKKGFHVYLDPMMLLEYTLPTLIVEHVMQPEYITEDKFLKDAYLGVFQDSVLYEIINRAALLALDNIESQRVETKLALNGILE